LLRPKPFGIFFSLKHMADSDRVRLVVFRLGPVVCAVHATAVREIIPAGRSTRIPGASAVVAGLVNLRGTLLTVVDARLAVGLADTGMAAESVLVMERGERSFGLAVDEVLDLIEVPSEELAAGEAMPGIDPGVIESIGRHGGLVFAVLDAKAMLAPVSG
jgi:purine-binding chemotaxis protein CheW